ncbi:class-II fumarase/aspartase family protein [Rhodococcus qingshengii]|uniref:class-II fumarase/aspartase family protein n=1 Tax=Rhodococcus qingshengii TaxID=334542 RepID=UPI001BE84DFE|nr:adenylosuccinate lyase family protein [Rhodococcus qingshengii]MBT2275891.1 adenylosuccinate lyase family protein [Rhodococcus qingshengii]
MNDTGLLSPVHAGLPIENVVSDDAWITAMLDTEVALATAQCDLGIIPHTALVDIAHAARTHIFDTRALAIASRGAANPVVVFVEELTRAVEAIDTDSANYVHRGSTSQDILDTAAMLITARATTLIIGDLERCVHALTDLARTHRTTVMAARTLAMHAVPTTFGAKIAVWINGLLDARDRLTTLRTQLPVQLGGAAGTLASYVEVAEVGHPDPLGAGDVRTALTARFARHLDLTAPPAPWHTTRTPIADTAAAMNITSGALGKIAVDVLSMARTEVLEVREPAAAGRGESSAMPQKRNPAMSTLVRSAALQVPALTSMMFQSMLAEDERPAGAWHAEWRPLRETLLLVSGAAATAAELVEGLTPDTGRMLTNLELTGGQIVSERLSAVLAPLAGKTHTKKLLQKAAFAAQETGRPLSLILADDPAVNAHLPLEVIESLLDPYNYLGAAPDIVDDALARSATTIPGPSALAGAH